MSVREDTSPGTVIYTVIATDRDVGQNGTVMYEIVGGNEQGKPEIKSFRVSLNLIVKARLSAMFLS